MFYRVSPELYLRVASELLAKIGESAYFSGSVSLDDQDVTCRLTGSYIVYRQPVLLPEGAVCRVADIVPVWWEFHTFADQGEIDNDFSFRELRPLIAC